MEKIQIGRFFSFFTSSYFRFVTVDALIYVDCNKFEFTQNEKWQKLLGFSLTENMDNFQAFF